MKKSLLSFSLLLLFLVGCEENNVQSEANNANERTEELTNIQTQVEELKGQLAELKSNTDLQYEQNNHTLNQLLLADEKMEHIIKHLPNVERKYGYIEQINRTDAETILRVQLVEMKEDATMPNNYRLEHLEVEENLTVSNDPLMYVLDSVEHVKIDAIDDLNEKVKDNERLFIFTVIDNRAVLIYEQYLP